MSKTRRLVFVGILIAIEVIFTRFLSFQTPIIRIGFGFLAISLASMLFGPMVGGIAATMGDLLGMMLFPKGAYLPGFTLSAFLGGCIYGLFLYKKPKTLLNIFLAVTTITLLVNLGLNTLWVSMLTGKAFVVIMVPRIIKELVLLPIQSLLIFLVWKYVGKNVENKYFY